MEQNKPKPWIGWAVFYKGEPSTFHKTKSMAVANFPSYMRNNFDWEVKRIAVCEYSPEKRHQFSRNWAVRKG